MFLLRGNALLAVRVILLLVLDGQLVQQCLPLLRNFVDFLQRLDLRVALLLGSLKLADRLFTGTLTLLQMAAKE